MWETYTMLGRQREEELLREAARLHHLSSRAPRRSRAHLVRAARTLLAHPLTRCAGVWASIRSAYQAN
jgi:hypothetical protein